MLVENISRIIGKDNLLIKRHPRNKLNRFGELGYNTLLNQEIPWEIYELDSKQPEHVLITFSSGAALNFHFFTTKKVKTILLYKCFESTNFAEMSSATKDWFQFYGNKYKDEVFVLSDEKELENILLSV